jgi:hypothetical protein
MPVSRESPDIASHRRHSVTARTRVRLGDEHAPEELFDTQRHRIGRRHRHAPLAALERAQHRWL